MNVSEGIVHILSHFHTAVQKKSVVYSACVLTSTFGLQSLNMCKCVTNTEGGSGRRC